MFEESFRFFSPFVERPQKHHTSNELDIMDDLQNDIAKNTETAKTVVKNVFIIYVCVAVSHVWLETRRIILLKKWWCFSANCFFCYLSLYEHQTHFVLYFIFYLWKNLELLNGDRISPGGQMKEMRFFLVHRKRFFGLIYITCFISLFNFEQILLE